MHQLGDQKFLILLTVPKSGTNLFRILMANYLAHLEGDLRRKTYQDLVARFPNTLEDYVLGKQKIASPPAGIRDFIYQHGTVTYDANPIFPGPVVAVVRNPLDYLISAYHFFFATLLELRNQHQHPFEIVDAYLPLLTDGYQAFRRLDCLLLHYEDLFERPAETFSKAVEYYGLEVKPELIELAVRHSSMSAAKEYENVAGPMHTGPNVLKNRVPGFRFVRSGAIGQWQEYFTDDQVAVIENKLAAAGLSLTDFICMPRALSA